MRQTVKTKRETFVAKKNSIINNIPLNCLEKTVMNASKTNKNSLKFSFEKYNKMKTMKTLT
jgi:hypothetical protein